ncbi:site-2 protease family protein [Sciscionella marina]|uniref:site-2 protease family protein n=1 Tax=Sciscionella marina TaxID=508770 RepID=UPI0003797B1D|nr:site-2 protease family protein [Sciscionella marina]
MVPDGGGLLLFRVRGVPVLLSATWWVGSLLIVALYTPIVQRILPGTGLLAAALFAVTFAVLLGISVLLHELGHCVVALRLNMGVRRMRLSLLGGATEVVRSPRRPAQEGLVAVAGPVVSLALAAVFAALLLVVPYGGPAWLLIIECAVANLAVGVFNALPGLPLDGGRILRAGVWALTGRRTLGTKIAVAGAAAISVALLAWAIAGLLANSEDRWLRLAVCALTAWFVIAGAREELDSEVRSVWPAGLTLGELVRPVLQLPAESPVADALAASAGRGVVLVRADGIAAGLLDETRAQQLAAHSPQAPAERAAESVGAGNVLLDSEDGEDIIERVRTTAAWQFLVLDEHGRPSGVLHRADLRTALHERRR